MFNIRIAKILEGLQAEAIQLAEDLRLQRDALGLYDFEKGTRAVQS